MVMARLIWLILVLWHFTGQDNFMKKILITTLFVLSLLFYLSPRTAFAVDVFFDSKTESAHIGEEFLVEVFINTAEVSVNAVEGIIKFPEQLLELKEVRDGNSLINFWVEKPRISVPGEVSFSGITPGGFQGDNKFLLGLVFTPKQSGNGYLDFKDMQALRNDGLGTRIVVSAIPQIVTVLDSPGTGGFPSLSVIDNEPPEEFLPLVASDPNIFDGKYFVAFSATDKGSGIYGYTISESILGPNGEYFVAESPYLLKDQSLSKNIYIKAIDKSGNSRMVTVEAKNPVVWLKPDIIFGIILLILCLLTFRKIWSKYIR